MKIDKVQLLLIQRRWYPAIKAFVREHMLAIGILILIALLPRILSNVPYLNLIFMGYTNLAILIFAGILLFRIRGRLLFLTTVALFILALRLTLLGKLANAESIGNLIYFLLWYIAWLYTKDIWINR